MSWFTSVHFNSRSQVNCPYQENRAPVFLLLWWDRQSHTSALASFIVRTQALCYLNIWNQITTFTTDLHLTQSLCIDTWNCWDYLYRLSLKVGLPLLAHRLGKTGPFLQTGSKRTGPAGERLVIFGRYISKHCVLVLQSDKASVVYKWGYTHTHTHQNSSVGRWKPVSLWLLVGGVYVDMEKGQETTLHIHSLIDTWWSRAALYPPTHRWVWAVSRDGSRGDGGVPLRRSPVGLQTARRSRSAEASSGGQGRVEPVSVHSIDKI